MLTGTGKLALAVPRDRQASVEPQLIAWHRRRFPEFGDKVASLYARGLSVRELQGHLRELYGIDVSPGLLPPAQAGMGVSHRIPKVPRLRETSDRGRS